MAEDTAALAILEAPQRPLIRPPSKRDRELYLLKKTRGYTPEELGSRYKMKPMQVSAAIERVELFNASFLNEELDLQLNQAFTQLIPKAAKVMAEAMTATTEVKSMRGKNVIMKKVADHATRLRAVEMMNSTRAVSMPKGGGFNQQINVNPGQTPQDRPIGQTRGFDFEGRLRQILAKRGVSEDPNLEDAEYEDEPGDELANELAEIGVELDEEEDDEDDGEDEE
jgi:hypothetical protein